MSEANIRGVAFLAVVKGLRIHRRRALEILPERLHTYLKKPVTIDDWFPMEDHLELLRALTEIVPETDTPWRWLGTLSADFELREISPTVIIRGDPQGTLLRLPEAWLLYHDTGELRIEAGDEQRARIELTDFPFTSEDYCDLLRGYFDEALRLSGAEGATIDCVSRGDDQASWVVTW